MKLHGMIGVRTQIVTAAEVTDGHAADSPEFVGLVQTTAANGFAVRAVSADKAYLGRENLEAVEAVGARPLVPFKINSQPEGHGEAWARLYHFFALNRQAFLREYRNHGGCVSRYAPSAL